MVECEMWEIVDCNCGSRPLAASDNTRREEIGQPEPDLRHQETPIHRRISRKHRLEIDPRRVWCRELNVDAVKQGMTELGRTRVWWCHG